MTRKKEQARRRTLARLQIDHVQLDLIRNYDGAHCLMFAAADIIDILLTAEVQNDIEDHEELQDESETASAYMHALHSELE